MYTDMTNKTHGYYSHSATLNVLTHDRHNSSSAIQNVFIPEIYPNKKQSEKKVKQNILRSIRIMGGQTQICAL